MRRVQLPDVDDTQGLVWYVDDVGGRSGVIGHDGDDPGITSQMFFDPATGEGVLLVANGVWDETQAVAIMTKLFAEATEY
jgi:hypothetical protein